MNKSAVHLLILCFAAAASFSLTYKLRPQSQPVSEAESVALRPFIAQIVEKHFLPNNKLAPDGTDYITVARKGDRSEARIFWTKSPDGKSAQCREFLDVPGRRRMVLEPFTGSMSTYHVPPVRLAHTVRANQSCPPNASDSTAERSQRLGYEVVRLIEKNPFAKGEVETVERWVAPALGCFPLTESSSVSSGPRNESQVVRLVEGEPPDSWFSVPDRYIERSPSQVATEYAARFPGHVFVSDTVAQMLDQSYYANR